MKLKLSLILTALLTVASLHPCLAQGGPPTLENDDNRDASNALRGFFNEVRNGGTSSSESLGQRLSNDFWGGTDDFDRTGGGGTAPSSLSSDHSSDVTTASKSAPASAGHTAHL